MNGIHEQKIAFNTDINVKNIDIIHSLVRKLVT